MPEIRINEVSKWFGKVQALSAINLQVESGEFLVLLGPSGCGKTTLLRCLAGVEKPNAGEIFLGDRCVFSHYEDTDVLAKDRNIGLVFQNYALYPHMTVSANISFGLKTRGMPKSRIPDAVSKAIDLVGLDGLQDRYPRQLSGGQQQRVAVARMVAAGPEIFLFDEPLSSLDPQLRVSLRSELLRVHRKIGATSVYVTHDQSEAMTLADRIAVMEKGRIKQIGSKKTIYRYPETISVADFTGNPKTNLILGDIIFVNERPFFVPEQKRDCHISVEGDFQAYGSQRFCFHVRPEDVVISPDTLDGSAIVSAVMPLGADTLVHVGFTPHTMQILVKQPHSTLELKPGQSVKIQFLRGNVFNLSTQRIIGSFGFNEVKKSGGAE